MATSEEIIQQAFREANYVAVGEEPTDAEVTEALPRLQNLLAALFGFELGEQLREWYVPQERAPRVPMRDPRTPTGAAAATSNGWDYPPANSRIIAKLSSDTTIYFPATPSDGSRMGFVNVGSTGVITFDGNGRLIDGNATLSQPVTGSTWFYRADIATWVLMAALAIDTQMPLPAEFDDLLVCGLAMRLAPRFGVKNIDQVIISRYGDMLQRLKTRYKQTEAMPATDQHAPLPASIYTGI
jgi:hypothetical protein